MPTSVANRGSTKCGVILLQDADQSGHDTGTRASDRMPQRNSTTIDVHTGNVNATKLPNNRRPGITKAGRGQSREMGYLGICKHHSCERFVDFMKLNVRHGDAGSFESNGHGF